MQVPGDIPALKAKNSKKNKMKVHLYNPSAKVVKHFTCGTSLWTWIICVSYQIFPHEILNSILFLATVLIYPVCEQPGAHYDILINHAIYDGTGSPGYAGSIGISADTIAAVGDLKTPGTGNHRCRWDGGESRIWNISELGYRIIDWRPRGMRICYRALPWRWWWGWSMGPLSEPMKEQNVKRTGRYKNLMWPGIRWVVICNIWKTVSALTCFFYWCYNTAYPWNWFWRPHLRPKNWNGPSRGRRWKKVHCE